MSLVELHQRYRNWAARLGQGPILAISVGASMVGVLVMSFAGPEFRPVIVSRVLPWFALIGGPLAAFDAWGAAMHRGRAQEGIIRALGILAMCWGFAVYAFMR